MSLNIFTPFCVAATHKASRKKKSDKENKSGKNKKVGRNSLQEINENTIDDSKQCKEAGLDSEHKHESSERDSF